MKGNIGFSEGLKLTMVDGSNLILGMDMEPRTTRVCKFIVKFHGEKF